MAYLDILSYDATSVYAQIKGLDTSYPFNNRVVQVYLYRNSTLVQTLANRPLGANVSQSEVYYFGGLTPDSNYVIECVIQNITGSGDITLSNSFRTGSSTSVSVTSIGSNFAGIAISGLQYSANQYDRFSALVYYGGGGYVKQHIWTSGSSTNSTSTTITGLESDTSYWVDVYARYAGTDYYVGDVSFTTDFQARPNDWNWEYNIVSGGTFYSQSGKIAYLMRAAHWNSFTSRINEFRDYVGFSNYSFTTATTSTTPAGVRLCINQAIDAINPMLSVANRMTSISSGGAVSAQIFINLRNRLNSIQ